MYPFREGTLFTTPNIEILPTFGRARVGARSWPRTFTFGLFSGESQFLLQRSRGLYEPKYNTRGVGVTCPCLCPPLSMILTARLSARRSHSRKRCPLGFGLLNPVATSRPSDTRCGVNTCTILSHMPRYGFPVLDACYYRGITFFV